MEGLAGEIVARTTSVHPSLASGQWSVAAPTDYLGRLFAALGMETTAPGAATEALAS
jgi:hypothetical protein